MNGYQQQMENMYNQSYPTNNESEDIFDSVMNEMSGKVRSENIIPNQFSTINKRVSGGENQIVYNSMPREDPTLTEIRQRASYGQTQPQIHYNQEVQQIQSIETINTRQKVEIPNINLSESQVKSSNFVPIEISLTVNGIPITIKVG